MQSKREASMINYDELDDLYDNYPSHDPMRRSTDPQGSLTDNRRKVKPNRDGAHKRLSDFRISA